MTRDFEIVDADKFEGKTAYTSRLGGLEELKGFLQDTEDLSGVVPASEREPPKTVESSRSQKLMRRVALAFCHESSKPLEQRRPIEKIVESIGANMDMYWQMVESPDWPKLVKWAVMQAVIMPRYAEIAVAATNLARTGDQRSVVLVMKIIDKLQEDTDSEFEKGLANLNDEGIASIMEEMGDTINAIKNDVAAAREAKRAPNLFQDDVRAAITSGGVVKVEERQEKVDHRKLHGLDADKTTD